MSILDTFTLLPSRYNSGMLRKGDVQGMGGKEKDGEREAREGEKERESKGERERRERGGRSRQRAKWTDRQRVIGKYLSN